MPSAAAEQALAEAFHADGVNGDCPVGRLEHLGQIAKRLRRKIELLQGGRPARDIHRFDQLRAEVFDQMPQHIQFLGDSPIQLRSRGRGAGRRPSRSGP